MKKEQVGRSVAAAAVAVGVLTNGAVESPGDLLGAASGDGEKTTTIVSASPVPDYDIYTDVAVEEDDDWRSRLRTKMQAAPMAMRVLVLMPLWCIGELVEQGALLLMAGLSTPLGTFLASLAVQGLLLLGVFAAVYKLLFPHTPVRELLSKKKFPWLVLGAAGITVADTALAYYWENWGFWRAILLLIAGYGMLLLLWHRLCGDIQPPQKKMMRVKSTYFGNNVELLKEMKGESTWD